MPSLARELVGGPCPRLTTLIHSPRKYRPLLDCIVDEYKLKACLISFEGSQYPESTATNYLVAADLRIRALFDLN